MTHETHTINNQELHNIHDVGYYAFCGPTLSKLRDTRLSFEFLISASPTTIIYLG
jgi:hypothetical protein